MLPFAEDVREFQFPSFSNLPSAFQPTEEQQEAADDFVKALDLAPPGKQEALKPELTPNLVIQVCIRYPHIHDAFFPSIFPFLYGSKHELLDSLDLLAICTN